MGCDNSKAVRVQPVNPAAALDNTKGQQKTIVEYDLDERGNKVRRKSASAAKQRSGQQASSPERRGSSESLEDDRSLASDRGLSATSKQSADSGLGEEYAHVITEFSEEAKVQEVESAFKPRDDLDLGITGVQLATRTSAKERSRQEETEILQSLREEGLITRPTAQASGGLSFEIVEAAGDGRPKPPPRLEKLALERKKKKKRAPASEEEIRDKLERAQRLRKEKEQARLDRLREMERTDALAALETFAQYQRSKEETITQRLDQASDNKDRHRRQQQEKLERRKRHAEEVRRRKQLALEGEGPTTQVEPLSPGPREGEREEEEEDEEAEMEERKSGSRATTHAWQGSGEGARAGPLEGAPAEDNASATTPVGGGDGQATVPTSKWLRHGGRAFRSKSPMMVEEIGSSNK